MEDKKHEDLDLIFVLKTMKNGIFGIIGGLQSILNFTLKKALGLALFAALGVTLSLGYFFVRKPYYTSEFSVSHVRFENDYCAEMLNNLNSYIHESTENTDLAEKLKIDPKTSKEVKSIAYKTLNQNIAKRFADSLSVILPFKVELEVYDNSVLPVLQTSILNYLESNEYALKIKEAEKQSLDNIEIRLNKEIKEIDSLKQIVNQSIVPRSTGNGIILGEPIDPVTVYKRSLDSYEKLMRLQMKKEFNNSFHLIVGYSKNSKPAGHGKLWYIGIGILSGYLVGLLILWRRKNKTATVA